MTPADAIRAIVDVARLELERRSEPAISTRPGPGRWCQKEILGHLIDSAANNHQRLVRAQLAERLEFPSYQQTGWVERQGYAELPWPTLIDFWTLYNRHLAAIIDRVSEPDLATRCRVGDEGVMTLSQLIDGYLVHLRHHLRQLGIDPQD